MDLNKTNSRRNFMGLLAAGTATGLTSFSLPVEATTPINRKLVAGAEDWIKKIKGTHRLVIDASEPHGGLPIIWTWVHYYTNNQTDAPDSDITGVLVLRHGGICYAMNDEVWKKYSFGEVFNVTDNLTGKPALRNPGYEPKEGDFPVAAIQGIKDLQKRGALVGVCDLAITVKSGAVAKATGGDAEKIKEEWIKGLHPDIQVVPSGVWALGRAQENGCGYIYAGG